VIEKKNDAESCNDMVEVISVIEMSKHREFEQEPERERGGER
jgi:hypothetical protein